MTQDEVTAAIEAIRRLKASYFRCMDLKLWDELAGVFTQDAVFDVRGALEARKEESEYAALPVVTGREAIVDYISTGLKPMISVHHGHMPEIDIESPVAARGIWPMSDMLVPPEGGPFRIFRGYGHYWERYAKQDGAWRIAELKLRRLYVEVS